MNMRLVLVDDNGQYMDDVHVQEEELAYAKEDGGAATVLLGNLLPGRYDDKDMVEVCITCPGGTEDYAVFNQYATIDDPKLTGKWPAEHEAEGVHYYDPNCPECQKAER